MPLASRWLKLCVLGGLITAITTLLPQDNFPVDTCYIYVPLPYFEFSEVSVEPNPTDGADAVILMATIELQDTDYDEEISGARCVVGEDTFEMFAVDTLFDGLTEEIVGRIPVADLEPDTYWIYLSAVTSMDWEEEHAIELLVTEYDPIED